MKKQIEKEENDNGDRNMNKHKVHVFIVGSKGIPAQYGGFETFVENLTIRKQSNEIMYHVSCMDNEEKHFMHNGADCFNVKMPLKGAKGRILHVARVLHMVEEWREENYDENVIVYILGCRIGPLLIPHAKKLKKLGVKIFVNPDGLEWKRDKWNRLEKAFLRYCERCLVLYSDFVICDSKNIEKYILKTYPSINGKTTYIAYGADVKPSVCPNEKIDEWLKNYNLSRENYYLIVGRFVPENNYETMISEFMKSSTKKPLVIISNVEKNKFYEQLKEKTKFDTDERIKFVGTVYEQELLKKIREEAFAYIHGHEVGGTNPSLLEALASTKVNLLLDVGFNKEVGEEVTLYWKKEQGNLAEMLEKTEFLYSTEQVRMDLGEKSTERIREVYSWEFICAQYEKLFLQNTIRLI